MGKNDNTPVHNAILKALLAALLFGLNTPLAKPLLASISPMTMAAFLYLGAAIGMLAIRLISRAAGRSGREAKITRRDAPWVALMVALDVAAPFLLMAGLKLTEASAASLLTNFEMVATTAFAMLFFREAVGARIWISIGIITLASMVLCLDFKQGAAPVFSPGSLLVLGACLCWGLENNCTRNLSLKDPAQIVVIKGFGSGAAALVIALATERMPRIDIAQTASALALGFVSYGLSIFFYVGAQRQLGAARTSMYYAAAPFLGVLLSFLLLGERPGVAFAVSAVLMLAGTALALYERHSHAHRHDGLQHDHRHSHSDGHHTHGHDLPIEPGTEHSHFHTHEALEHAHEHRPDSHHRHPHNN